MATGKRVDPDTKNITHMIFRCTDEDGDIEDHAVVLSEISILRKIPEDGTDKSYVEIYNAMLDKTYYTNKIRAVTSIEVSKFINGTFDPFRDLNTTERDS